MSNNKVTSEYERNLIREAVTSNRGGKEAIERLLVAYGFNTRIALCSHLGISQSTMANRYSRDTFPADWILICAADTGASLTWLATGKGQPFTSAAESRTVVLSRKKISNGIILENGDSIQDKTSLPDGLTDPFVVISDKYTYLIDIYQGEVVDGLWLIEIDNIASIRELIRFPGGKIRVENGKASFECQVEDITVLGKIIMKTILI